MSKRLNGDQKRKIVRRVVAASFDKRVADLKKRENSLARRVRNSLIPAHHREAIDALPRNFFRRSEYGALAIRVADVDGQMICSLDADADLRIPSFMQMNAHIVKDAGLLDDIKQFAADWKQAGAERADFERKTAGVIETFTSSAKLLETWPTLRELLGDDFFDVKAANPIVANVNELDAVLQAGKPFEQVAA